MSGLVSYLQNLRPDGTSEMPTSKLRSSAYDSETMDENEEDINNINTIADNNLKSDIHKDKKNKQTSSVKQERVSDIVTHQDDSIKVQTSQFGHIPNENDHIASDEVHKIKKLWRDLGIGQNGYLTVEELERICLHIGMNELDKEDLQNLFVTIDTDQDGKVSLSEFSKGLKSHGKLKFSRKIIDDKGNKRKQLNNGSSKLSGKTTSKTKESYFTSIDPDKRGHVDSQKIIDFWASGGVINGKDILEYLDFNLNMPVDLLELSDVLDDECNNADLDAVILSVIITFKKEIEYYRSMLKIMQTAYDRSIEPKSAKKDGRRNLDPEYLQEIESEMIARQDVAQAALVKQTHQYENILTDLQGDKTQLNQQIIQLNQELVQFEQENGQLRARVMELEEVSARQEQELDAVAELHRKMDLEIKILRNGELTFGQTVNQHQLVELKERFEKEIENANKINMESSAMFSTKKQEEISADIENLQKRINELEKELWESNKENDNLKRKVDFHINENISKTHTQLYSHADREMSKNLEEIERENQILRSEIADLKDNNGKIEFDYRELSSENEILSNKVKSLQKKLDISIKREGLYENKLNIENNKSSKELQANLDNLHVVIQEKNNQLEANRNKILEVEDCLHEKQIKLDKLSKRINELETENIRLLNSLKTTESGLNEVRDQYIDEMKRKVKCPQHKENGQDVDDISEDLENCIAEIRSKKTIIQKLEEANDHLSRSLRDAVEKFERLASTKVNMESEEILSENIRLTQQNLRQDEEINKLHMKMAKLQSAETFNNDCEIRSLQQKLKLKEKRIESLEDVVKKSKQQNKSTQDVKSLKKYDYLQFQYDELNKKYKIQLDQVDATDSLLKEVHDENAKLLKSLQRSDNLREQAEMKVLTLEEKVKNLQDVLNKIS